ncbi:DciA family protein [Endomicrobium proavitum]|uniref:DUF721 domain-containing protein n=1 Tax=Endomicrobium proavitum TaxID=1408281 RepID=A0A0G3WKU0_9BACT|nr:DciA family protein [Endomicrobium proavitum]AKL98485.1 hypothetical protein Epro_1106 [Endomicrobium proavitum]
MTFSFFEEKKQKYKAERKSNLTEVSGVMEALKKMLGLDSDFFTIAKVWDKEVNVDSAEISGFKDGVIYAQTPYSAAVHEINLRKKEIIRRLNQYIGTNKIKNIKVTIK